MKKEGNPEIRDKKKLRITRCKTASRTKPQKPLTLTPIVSSLNPAPTQNQRNYKVADICIFVERVPANPSIPTLNPSI